MKQLISLLIGFLFCLPPLAFSENKVPQVGDEFPVLNLQFAADDGKREYLGITGLKTFKLTDIKADALIIQIFSMYCPHCQKEAPNVNQFFQKLTQNPALKDKIKLIGIGTGNSAYEVAVFQKKYQVQFPLFEDPDFKMHNRIGEVRTPYFFGIRSDGGKKATVFFSKLGGFENPDQYLNDIVKLSGIEAGGSK
jgi:peroxiredoxin